jgi:hypothetical protein
MQYTIRVSQQKDARPDPFFRILNDRVAALGLMWQQNSTSPLQGSTETSVAYLRRSGTVHDASRDDRTSAFASTADDFASATIVDVHQRHAVAQDGTEADNDQEIVFDLNGFRYTTHTYDSNGYVPSGAAGSTVEARLVTDDHMIELRMPGLDKLLRFRIERADKL